ncbi:hypothetical protein [Streptomyces sp. H39-S7]|uniref:hypothetical protein n=1 Tax=Streptomyces sp. H39-S7 TaxID=3004357 RepID=UPI0022AF5449|nr:hypothetical protein [Streptomyces sp. H39-S7]MCZ4124980.1 hypothetical protein [Streptomyces sp. H39-S7]
MDDPQYFDLVRAQLENQLISDSGSSDGHLQVYAKDVPRLSVLLIDTLLDSPTQPKQILAADLTTDPGLLTQRREYLAANRRLLEAGGSVHRLFIASENDLCREEFARAFVSLVDHHRQLGVTCGLAVRDRLGADQAVDVVVIAAAAVLVEEEQGDAEYTNGRSSVYFQGVQQWTNRFESAWGQGEHAAPRLLQAYDAVARPMLDSDTWDTDHAAQAVAAL